MLTKRTTINEDASFLRSFDQYRGMLYAIALRMLGHGEDAKDAVQETFIRAYTHLHTLQDKATLGGWLKRIVYNHCLMELRHRRKAAVALNRYAKEKELFENAERDFEKAPEEIKNTLAQLSEALQLTAMLRFFGKNSSYEEIASILSIPVGTVRSRLAEGRTKLASLLSCKKNWTKSNRAKEMEDFYQFHIHDMYDDTAVRNAFLDHFDKQIFISLTSGKSTIGRDYMEEQIKFDLKYGPRVILSEAHSSGNISILELCNVNPSDHPNLCPLFSTFILVHPKKKAEKAFLHNALPLAGFD